MVDIVDPSIEKYLLETFNHEDEVLKEMEKIAEEKEFPIVGPLVGRTIMQLCSIFEFKSNKILELGSGYGYSAQWFAKGSNEEVIIYCTDFDEDNKKLATKYFQMAGIDDRVKFHIGDALEIAGNLDKDEKFDIIFCDIDKSDYPKALDISLPRLRKGGLLIFDNTLWSGKVLEEKPDDTTKGVIEFNKRISSNQELLSNILPIRDGISISIKV